MTSRSLSTSFWRWASQSKSEWYFYSWTSQQKIWMWNGDSFLSCFSFSFPRHFYFLSLSPFAFCWLADWVSLTKMLYFFDWKGGTKNFLLLVQVFQFLARLTGSGTRHYKGLKFPKQDSCRHLVMKSKIVTSNCISLILRLSEITKT